MRIALYLLLFLSLFSCDLMKPFEPTQSITVYCFNENGNKIDIEQAKSILGKKLLGLPYQFELNSVSEDEIEILLDDNSDIDKVVKHVQSSGNIEFWHTFKNTKVGNEFYEIANRVLSNSLYPGYMDSVKNKIFVKEEPLSKEENTSGYLTDEEVAEMTSDQADETSIQNDENIKKFRKLSPLSTYLYPYADENGQWVESPILGYARLSDTAIINSFLKNYGVLDSINIQNLMLMWESISSANTQDGQSLLNLYLIKNTKSGNPELSGSEIISAMKAFDPISKHPMVSLTFSKNGEQIWGDITELSARYETGIAITLDNKVFSAPIANGRIEGGKTQITGGSFMGPEGVNEADRLTDLINLSNTQYSYSIIEIKRFDNGK